MTSRLLPAVLIVLALGADVPAQPKVVRLRKGIRWSRSIKEALVTAELTDAPIIVYAYLRGHAACLNFEEEVLADKRLRRLSALFVMVGVDGEKHGDVVRKFGIVRYPALLYLDSAGKPVKLLDSNLTRARVLSYMARTFFISMYNSGVAAREEGDIRTAVRRFKTLTIIGQGTPPAAWAKNQLRRIAAQGLKKLSQAQIALDAKDLLKAMTLLDELAYEYRATEAGLEATKLMEKLADDADARKALQEVTRRRLAARLLRRARKLEAQQDLEGALILYWDVVRDYPNTPAQARASERAAALAADRQLALKAAKTRMLRDCSNWMEMAQGFELNRNRDKAIEYYQRIITHYGGTSHARKAEAAINNLLGVRPAE